MPRALLAAFALLAPACAAQERPPADVAPAPLTLVAELELPEVAGRLDHLALDAGRARLFVAALGADGVEVVDLAAGRWLRRLDGLAEPQGLLFLPELDRLLVTCGGAGTCVAYDGETLAPVRTVEVGADADNLRLDARRGEVLIACGEALAVLDARTLELRARIALGGGHPEGFQLTPDGARALVDVPAARAVVVVDLERREVTGRWTLEDARANYPLALVPAASDSPARALCLVGCRAPAELHVRALADGAPLQHLELSGDVDDVFHDARRERVYAACGAGYVDCFERTAAGLGARVRVPSAPGARTCLWVPARDRLYVAAPRRDGRAARVLVFAPSDASHARPAADDATPRGAPGSGRRSR
ncbi:MAG: hypothetical protein H6828_07715 [Planctomycetes bacterium]|nr:hypothetical protein [Planctomycetota bacterium]